MSAVCISYRLHVRQNDEKQKTIEIPFELTFTNKEIVTRAVSMRLKLNRPVLIAETTNKL
jgi:hypothetical protein